MPASCWSGCQLLYRPLAGLTSRCCKSPRAAAPTTAKTKAPAWLKRPCGASFGFGGKLVQVCIVCVLG